MSIATPKTPNLIDTVGAGYRALNRRLWVITIPAGFSFYLWLGAPLGLGALAERMQTRLAALEDFIKAPGQAEVLIERILLSDLRLVLAWLNFVPVLPPPLEASESAVGLSSMGQLLGVVVLINLLTLLLSSYFLTLLSEVVHQVHRHPRASLRYALRVALTIIGYLVALLGVGFILALPFLALSTLVILTLPQTTLLILLAWYVVIFWAYIYTGFAPEAILISRAGPLRAIYYSVNMVRHNMAGTLGLLILSYVIVSGLSIVWRQLAVNPLGLTFAILMSAYVGSGLCAARLEFYRQRWM
ncbi:hypothetical protein [Candidatus Viridilinea mediisalina]|uniref:Glycerophosphoryl diester phosphodiesterase membrane domain-containing protein n=1 Tax=Candidatus Viridilinea mediisalina TaxID=2024553 RepID=A0A2A6RLR3_9CHLR|nr:hypothetical protein [Candidatus Viridilinea mediisalina]PDW04044.1 hypothetical protein CJ255_05590 [Candidatus Viridilinea mediisalina]